MAQQQVFDLFSGDLLAAAVDLIFSRPWTVIYPSSSIEIRSPEQNPRRQASALCCGLL